MVGINKTFEKFDDEIEKTISGNKKKIKESVDDTFSYGKDKPKMKF